MRAVNQAFQSRVRTRENLHYASLTSSVGKTAAEIHLSYLGPLKLLCPRTSITEDEKDAATSLIVGAVSIRQKNLLPTSTNLFPTNPTTGHGLQLARSWGANLPSSMQNTTALTMQRPKADIGRGQSSQVLLPLGEISTFQKRHFYFPRPQWFAWKQRQVHLRQRKEKLSRNIQPRVNNEKHTASLMEKKEINDYLYTYSRKMVRIGTRNLIMYGKLVAGRQLVDSHDFVESLGRQSTAPILQLFRRAKYDLTHMRGCDPARLYIKKFETQRGRYVHSMRMHAKGKVGIVRSPRNAIKLCIREMSLEEYFQKLYVIGKVPTSVTQDMRLALMDRRAGPQSERDWSPYLTSTSRLHHRRNLKWMDNTKQLDYHELLENWMRKYEGNMKARTVELREGRGLSGEPSMSKAPTIRDSGTGRIASAQMQ